MMEIKYVLDCPLHPRVTPTKLYSDVKVKSRYFIVRVASRSWQDPTISVTQSPCLMVANPATIKKANEKILENTPDSETDNRYFEKP